MKSVSLAQIKRRCTSVQSWHLPKTETAFAPPGVWSNADVEPVPREDWTWTSFTLASYWTSDLLNAGSWSAVSSFVILGLTWWESVLAIALGALLISILATFNGIIGARLHTPFAITARAPFGTLFSRFVVVSRMVPALFWMSINTYQGGLGVTQMLIAIWPSYATLPNTLPISAGVTSSQMLSFFLFWAMQFPFLLIHPRKLQPLFLLKGVTLPITALAMMAWSISAAGSQAAVVIAQPSTLSGSAGYLSFMTAVTASMGTWSTMACNIGDFTRYGKKESSAALQILFIPGLFGITALFGAITSQMCLEIYGELLYQPFDIIAKWQGTPGGRAAAFFAALAWSIGNLGTNITANSISAANDLATLMPKWFNIRRGQIFTAIVGVWAFAPWKVLQSAGSFISFMSSYSIVLTPIASILAADIFFVKHGKVNVPQLYDPHGLYYYTYGTNWRAVVALIVAVAPNLPGMINGLNPDITIGGAVYLYAVADIYGMLVAAGVHTLLSRVFPDHASLVDEGISAQDVIDGKVPGYEKYALRKSSSQPDAESFKSEQDVEKVGEGVQSHFVPVV